jgi:hypothetical protein
LALPVPEKREERDERNEVHADTAHATRNRRHIQDARSPNAILANLGEAPGSRNRYG